MDSKICMNSSCSASSTIRWKNGWPLRSGGFANLCDKCGSAYDQFVFCDMFHSKESGWRECNSCGKRLHCGCIASKSSLELLDSGGVKCISCMKDSNISSIPSQVPQGSILQSPHKVLALASKSSRDGKLDDFVMLSTSQDYKMDDDAIDRGKIMQHSKEMEHTGRSTILVAETNNPNESLGKTKKEPGAIPVEAGSACFSNINQTQVGSLQIIKRDESKESLFDKEAYESPTHACLSITFGTSNLGQVEASNSTPGTSNLLLPIPTVIAEGKEQSKGSSSFQHGHRSRHLLPKPSNKSPSTGSESSKDMLPQIRVARPPAEGRGRNQLLPRYWPRITDQELQQITGDSNSTIVPLFEKVLSASDAGRIGRLVLPKACAEAYFPPISQPEGLPLKIQDAKGKDWLFQFRFWPNNNSRMYVLEGVTPCIQSMQLQAGDTVTFSRIDPEGKLVMGFRKATNSLSLQDAQISSLANCGIANETFISGVLENLPSISGYSGLLNSLKGSADPHLNTSFEQINQSDADICWNKSEKHEGRMPFQSVPGQERKRSRNLSSKSKRLHMDCEDALELKLTWEEAQDLLRPPPSVKPSIVVIEDHEFEEYEEPPVFGKRTIFTARPSGGHDQWAQCDICCRWRRLPVDALLPPRWTCSDNIWDPRRCSCSAPDEMSSKELDDLLRLTIDFKKRRSGVSQKSAFEREVSGLDALATAAVLGDNGNSGTPSISATTTKHPRHRPGCTCIVCIQPPSGKGPKHKPTCTCNVCMTVKRRFKTLMLRKKKRQSEREAETARKKLHAWTKDEAEVDSSSRCLSMSNLPENEALLVNTPESGQARIMAEKAETGSSFSACFKEDMSKGGIDLNCHPERDDDLQVGSSRVSMMSLLQVASLPLDTYLKQHGLASLICEQQLSSGSHVQALGVGDSEGRPMEESYYTSVVQDNETVGDDGFYVPDQPQEDTV